VPKGRTITYGRIVVSIRPHKDKPLWTRIYRLNPVILTFLFNKYYQIPVIFITGMQYGISNFHIRQWLFYFLQ
jgi:hypothetical protein